MSNTNKKLESLKKQYEAARINEEHSKWTMEDASSSDRVLNRDLLIRESGLMDKYHEEARQAAVQITALVGLESSTQILHYINLDVERYMKRRKSEHKLSEPKPQFSFWGCSGSLIGTFLLFGVTISAFRDFFGKGGSGNGSSVLGGILSGLFALACLGYLLDQLHMLMSSSEFSFLGCFGALIMEILFISVAVAGFASGNGGVLTGIGSGFLALVLFIYLIDQIRLFLKRKA